MNQPAQALYWTEGWDSPLPQWAAGRILFRDSALVVPSEDGERLAHAVRRARVYVVLGCNEMDSRPEVQTIYNSLLFFAPDGTVLGRHRKLMPTFAERLFWGQGHARDLLVFDRDIGRLGGLICGEHLMTLARACLIAQGEDLHVAVFPGAFMVSGCAVLHDADVAAEFPYKGRMNIGYAHGGSEVMAPLGITLAGLVYGEALIYAEIEAWMIKATKAIVDTMGHYARPDVLRLLVHGEQGWQPAGRARDLAPVCLALTDEALARAAEARDVDPATVVELAEEVRRAVG
jgi:nitrilase